MSWVSGHFVCGGGRTWTGYGTWDAGPQGHHLLSLQLPFAKHREEENTTGRVDGRQNSYSLLMGGRVGVRDWA